MNKKDKHGKTPLMKVAENEYNKCVDLLIKTQAHVKKHDKDACAAVIFVAREGHYECLHLLLIAWADVKKQNSYGWTTFMQDSYDGL